jgi:tetratricopeptide (TPR) repeat protein
MNTTKRITTLVLTGALLLAGAACKKKDGETTTPDGSGGGDATTATPGAPTAAAREDFDKVTAKYTKAKEKGPLTPGACEDLANDYTRLYKQHGDQMIAARFNAGAIWDECGDRKKAEEIYSELAKKKYPLAISNLGAIYFERGDRAKGMDLFKQAVELDKKTAFSARNNLAAAHRDRYSAKPDAADFKEAEDQIRRVLAVDSSNKVAYENLARLYYDRGRLKDKSYKLLANLVVTQAIRVLEKEGSASADIWNLKGLLFIQEGNQVDALKAFKKAAEIDPNHVDANLNIAFIAIRFRDYDTAEKSLTVAMKNEAVKKDIEAWLALGVARRGQKKYKEAEDAYNAAAKLSANDPRPIFNLAVLYNDHMIGEGGDTKKLEEIYNVAKKHFQKAQGIAGTNKQWAYFAQESKDRVIIIDDAIDQFRKQEEMAKQMEELAKLEAEQKKAEQERLKELERQAMEEEAAGGGTPPADAPK